MMKHLDNNNNSLHKQRFPDLVKGQQDKGDEDEEFYDVSSEDESSISGKTRDDKSEISEEEEHSDSVEGQQTRAGDGETRANDGKPTQSYIALIAMAILSSPKRKMVLSDIYKYILDNYPFYKTQDKSWRNSIRHNLSLNECFVKAGRSENGKGNYWAIHPSNVEDFAKGDYRRRRARRKTKRPSHPFGLYSEFLQPYTVLSPIYGFGRKMVPYFFSGCETRCDVEQKIKGLFPKEKQRKSFTIDSILGLDKEKKIESCDADIVSDQSARRHHSAPSYNQPQSPRYERSAFSPVYRNITDYYPMYTVPTDYYRRSEHFPHTMFSTRDSLQEFSRIRKSFS